MAAPASKGKVWAYVAVACVAILALLGGLFATGALRFGASQNVDPNLRASGSQGPSTLPSSGEQGPNSLGVTGQSQPNLQSEGQKVVMPDDVRKWLEHLERIEKRRMDMASRQVGQALEMLIALQAGGTMPMIQGLLDEAATGEEQPMKGPIRDTVDSAEQIREGWRVLNADFNSYPPPAECVPIRNDYDVALRETGAMISDILGAVANAEADRSGALAALMKMRGTSKHIDASAVDTDDGVQRICDKYETRKWFKVTADVGGGLTSRGGF
jgi:hypothetical protein